MKLHDGYYQDLFLAFLFRFWLTLGGLCVIALVAIGCSRSETGSPSLDGSAVRVPLELGEGARTRNQLPQGGCDEKSDSSLRRPLGW